VLTRDKTDVFSSSLDASGCQKLAGTHELSHCPSAHGDKRLWLYNIADEEKQW